MQRIEAVQETVNTIYDTLGIAKNKSRKRINVQIRAAISVALKPYCSTYEIGEAIDGIGQHVVFTQANILQTWITGQDILIYIIRQKKW